jgi:hypothetical protein
MTIQTAHCTKGIVTARGPQIVDSAMLYAPMFQINWRAVDRPAQPPPGNPPAGDNNGGADPTQPPSNDDDHANPTQVPGNSDGAGPTPGGFFTGGGSDPTHSGGALITGGGSNSDQPGGGSTSPATGSSLGTAAIAGLAVGGVAIILLAAVALLLLRRRRREQPRSRAALLLDPPAYSPDSAPISRVGTAYSTSSGMEAVEVDGVYTRSDFKSAFESSQYPVALHELPPSRQLAHEMPGYPAQPPVELPAAVLRH